MKTILPTPLSKQNIQATEKWLIQANRWKNWDMKVLFCYFKHVFIHYIVITQVWDHWLSLPDTQVKMVSISSFSIRQLDKHSIKAAHNNKSYWLQLQCLEYHRALCGMRGGKVGGAVLVPDLLFTIDRKMWNSEKILDNKMIDRYW